MEIMKLILKHCCTDKKKKSSHWPRTGALNTVVTVIPVFWPAAPQRLHADTAQGRRSKGQGALQAGERI